MNTISINRTAQGLETEAIIVTTESQLAAIIERVMGKYVNQLQPEQPPKRISYWSAQDEFDLDDASEYLNISKSYLWKMNADGKIPCSKVFGRLKFRKNELDAWIARKNEEGKRGADISASALTLAKSANRRMRTKKCITN